jgi:hypothetical protein
VKKTTRRKTASAKKRPVKKATKTSTRRTTRAAAPKRTTAKPVRKTKVKRGNGGKEWTPAEVKYLRTAYKNTPTNSIADKLNRTLSSVRSKAVALSLKKAATKKAAPRKAAPKKAAKRTTTRRKTRW